MVGLEFLHDGSRIDGHLLLLPIAINRERDCWARADALQCLEGAIRVIEWRTIDRRDQVPGLQAEPCELAPVAAGIHAVSAQLCCPRTPAAAATVD